MSTKREAELEAQLEAANARILVLTSALRAAIDKYRTTAAEWEADLAEAEKPAAQATAARSAKSSKLAARARELRAKGRSVPEIAAEIQRTERHVRGLLKR